MGPEFVSSSQDQAWNGILEVFTDGLLTVYPFDVTKHGDPRSTA